MCSTDTTGCPTSAYAEANNYDYGMYAVQDVVVVSPNPVKVNLKIGGEWYNNVRWRDPKETGVCKPADWGGRPTFNQVAEQVNAYNKCAPIPHSVGHVLLEIHRFPNIPSPMSKWPNDLAPGSRSVGVTTHGWLLWAEFDSCPGHRFPLVPGRHFDSGDMSKMHRATGNPAAVFDQGTHSGDIELFDQFYEDYGLDEGRSGPVALEAYELDEVSLMIGYFVRTLKRWSSDAKNVARRMRKVSTQVLNEEAPDVGALHSVRRFFKSSSNGDARVARDR